MSNSSFCFFTLHRQPTLLFFRALLTFNCFVFLTICCYLTPTDNCKKYQNRCSWFIEGKAKYEFLAPKGSVSTSLDRVKKSLNGSSALSLSYWNLNFSDIQRSSFVIYPFVIKPQRYFAYSLTTCVIKVFEEVETNSQFRNGRKYYLDTS